MDNNKSEGLLIPNCLEELTPSWFHTILNLKTHTSSKEEVQLNIISNADNGVGFLSSLFRVEITIQGHRNYFKSLIVKLLPQVELYRELTHREQFDQTEINFYKLLLPELVGQIPELNSYFCECFFASSGHNENAIDKKSSALVLEDLKPGGFSILTFSQEFSTEQIQAGLDFLAKLHAATKLVEANCQATILQLFPRSIFSQLFCTGQQIADKWAYFFKSGFPNFDKFIRTYSEASFGLKEHVVKAHDSVQNMCTRIFDILSRSIDAGQAHPTIIHNDLWRCNILVRTTKNADNSLIKFIDWQTLDYLDPTFDLATFLLSTLPLEQLNRAMVDNLALHYYKLYMNSLNGIPLSKLLKEERSETEFMKFFTTFGMSYAFVWFANSCEANDGLFPEYLPRFWKVFEQLYLEYEIHVFIKEILA